MRRGGDDDGPPPIEIELLHDGGSDDAEVSFGGARRASGARRPKGWIIGAGAVVALLVAVVVATSGGDSDDAAAPSTTTPIVPTTTDAPTRTTRPRPSTTTTAYVAPAAFATDPGWRVYLADSERGTIRAFDPSTGAVSDVSRGQDVYLVAPDPDGEPAFMSYNNGYDALLPAGDGTAWGTSGSDLVRIDLGTFREVERIEVGDFNVFFAPQVMGTDADGRPVVLLRDLRTYSVAPDGTRNRFAEEAIQMVVSRGRYVGTSCDEAGVCRTTLRTGDVTVELSESAQQIAISPAGTHAVVFQAGGSAAFQANERGFSYRVIDLRNGRDVGGWDPPNGTGYGFYNFNREMPGWSPDGRYFFIAFGRELHMFDATTDAFVRLPGELSRPSGVVGVA